MNVKHQEVHDWLEKVFSGQEIPSYEVTEETVDELYKLKLKNEDRDMTVQLIIDDMKRKKEEYQAEFRRTHLILKQLGLDRCALSQSGSASLHTIARVAQVLGTKDASNTSLLLALMETSNKLDSVKEERTEVKRKTVELVKRTSSEQLRASRIDKDLKRLHDQSAQEEAEVHKKATQAAFLASKCKQYQQNIKRLEHELRESGAEPSLYHTTLVRRAEDLTDLRNQLHPIRAKLNSYYKLPPDLSLAKVKVEEARRELNALEQKLALSIDSMRM